MNRRHFLSRFSTLALAPTAALGLFEKLARKPTPREQAAEILSRAGTTRTPTPEQAAVSDYYRRVLAEAIRDA